MSNLVPITVAQGDGIDVYAAETLPMDAYRCRFTARGATSKQTVALLGRVLEQGVDIVKTETLRTFNGEAGCTLSQGQ